MLLLIVGAPLEAQVPADQQLLHRLDSALVAGAPFDTARSSDGTVRQLQDGVRWVLEWQRTKSRTPVERGLFSFNAAGARRSNWPWPEYFAARTFLLMHFADVPILASPGQLAGETFVEATFRHLDLALAVDSTFMPARRMLAGILLSGGDRELDKNARRALARELTLDVPLPEMQIAHGRALRNERRYGEALAAFEAAVFNGGDRSLLALERARTLTALGDTTAATTAYWQGVDHMTPAARPVYRQDLGWIVSEDSLASFDAEPLERVGSWLYRFWAERDAAAANRPGERLQTHLSRWVTAHAKYRVPLPWRRNFYTRFWGIAGGADCVANASAFVDSLPLHPPTIPGDPRFREPLLDHRGFLWMRHGPPLNLLALGGGGPAAGQAESELERVQQGASSSAVVDPTRNGSQIPDMDPLEVNTGTPGQGNTVFLETWIYWIEGGWRSFHLGDSDTYGRHAATTLLPNLPVNLGDWPWLALASYMPRYMRAAVVLNPDFRTQTPKSCFSQVTEALTQMRADAHVGITTDSDSPPLIRPWNAAIRSFAIGGAPGTGGKALVTFAMPARDLEADTLADGRLAWRIKVRMVAYRPRDGASHTLEPNHTVVTGPLKPGAALRSYIEVPLESGDWQLAIRTWQSDDSSGAYALRRHLVVDDGPGLTLSDVVTGITGGLAWPAGDNFPVNTLGVWPERGEAELWFQVRGLPEGTPYRATIEVVPTEEGRKERISIASDEVSEGLATVVRRTLGLQQLREGVYRLVVTVQSGGQTATRTQDIFIAKK